jgi:hypothetical protein
VVTGVFVHPRTELIAYEIWMREQRRHQRAISWERRRQYAKVFIAKCLADKQLQYDAKQVTHDTRVSGADGPCLTETPGACVGLPPCDGDEEAATGSAGGFLWSCHILRLRRPCDV